MKNGLREGMLKKVVIFLGNTKLIVYMYRPVVKRGCLVRDVKTN